MTDAKQKAWRDFCRKLVAIGVDPYAPDIPVDDPRQEQVAAIVAEYQAATTHKLALPPTWEEQEGRGHPLFVESKRPWHVLPKLKMEFVSGRLDKSLTGDSTHEFHSRRFTPEQKAQIVRRHLANKESVSALAEEFGLQPSQIHLWVNQLLAQADKAFERSSGNTRADKAQAQRIQQLEAKLATKNEVIAELLEENVKSKKELGEL